MLPAKLLLTTLCLGLLAAPQFVGAHNDTLGGAYPRDDARDDKPSGIYVGAAGRYVETRMADDDLDFLHYHGDMVCDLEVHGDGSAPSPLDDASVDGSPGGIASDGAWDDGGHGGVCHTPNYTYGYAAYNTQGCDYEEAWAFDNVLGDNVWIATACDWKSDVPATPSPYPHILQPGESACAPTPCTGTTCGPDGRFDSFNFGFGNGSHIGMDGTGVPYSNPPNAGCSAADGVAVVFVLDALINGDDCQPDCGAYEATSGWVN